jgi:hypothetical protein
MQLLDDRMVLREDSGDGEGRLAFAADSASREQVLREREANWVGFTVDQTYLCHLLFPCFLIS